MIACQNEEALIAASIISFIPLSDEIIVVDNGSEDRSVAIAHQVSAAYPDKVRVYELPSVQHLHENRQFAFEKSAYTWIVRADADFICHTGGYFDARLLRRYLMELRVPPVPLTLYLDQPTVVGDFFHCLRGEEIRGSQWRMPRIYRWFPGMRFGRNGRREEVSVQRIWPKRLRYRIYWPNPIWMHCDVKSEQSYFLRAFRADWRESGYEGSLLQFIAEKIGQRSAATNSREALIKRKSRKYFEQEIGPRLEKFEIGERYYPDIVKRLMQMGAGYACVVNGERCSRRYLGPPDTRELLRLCAPLVEKPAPLPKVFIKGV